MGLGSRSLRRPDRDAELRARVHVGDVEQPDRADRRVVAAVVDREVGRRRRALDALLHLLRPQPVQPADLVVKALGFDPGEPIPILAPAAERANRTMDLTPYFQDYVTVGAFLALGGVIGLLAGDQLVDVYLG